jgi:DNA replication protein DnaC
MLVEAKTMNYDVAKMKSQAATLKLVGLTAHWDELTTADWPWVARLLDWEENTRKALSVDRRLVNAKLGRFKPISDFDWGWPKSIDREAIEHALTHKPYLKEATNILLVGTNGTGKTTIAKAFALEAIMAGQTALFVEASKMLGDLASQRTDHDLVRKLRRYSQPQVLVIDEVGYLSYSDRHADLLFEVINRRYENKPTIITTNKPFTEWQEVFPNASCVVSLVDRLVHHSEIFVIEGASYRVKEATERSRVNKRRQAKIALPKPEGPAENKLDMEQEPTP